MDTEVFIQRLQCSRADKIECLYTVQKLMDLYIISRNRGLLAMDKELHESPNKYPNLFLRKAVILAVDMNDTENIKKVLYNYILSGNYVGQKFLEHVIISEAILAIRAKESFDYIFSFLIPSYFGIEFEQYFEEAFGEFKTVRNIVAVEPPAHEREQSSENSDSILNMENVTIESEISVE